MEYNFWNIAPIALLPFFAFVINAFIVRKYENLAVAISTTAIFVSFLYASRIFFDFIDVYSADYYVHKIFPWIDISASGQIFKIDLGFYIDNMTAMMLFMVTGVGFLIHLFSTYYMKGDSGGFGRFFVYVSLFISAMLGLVLANNLLLVFIFWEVMGFCSYSLIGFYNKKRESGSASIKAFMTTRVGDVFFLLGIAAIWASVGNVNFVDIYAAIADGKFTGQTVPFLFWDMPLAGFAGFCIFMGTIGKSAQFPLNVWLPDAMKGPTPCSALIHAATMVAAGVYLSLRVYPLLELGNLNYFIALIGGITAFGAATIALVQTDLKAVLAFSTISQLGYMVLGIGVGSYNAAFMHLITHAIFKACLFLAAGSVIHSLHDHHTHAHVQEMPRMGGLFPKMKFTATCMWLCTFAIAGVPFFSGFVSKDRILGDALYAGFYSGSAQWFNMIPALLGFAGAVLTAFYMFRMMLLTFHGENRDKDVYDHCHEEKFSVNRNLPLIILAVFTLGVWFSGSLTGQGIIKVVSPEKKDWFKTLIVAPKVEKFTTYRSEPLKMSDDIRPSKDWPKSVYSSNYGLSEKEEHAIHAAHVHGAIISVIIVIVGVFVAMMMYWSRRWNPGKVVNSFPGWHKALQNKYYMDNFYIDLFIKKWSFGFFSFLSFFDMQIYDRFFIDIWEKINRAIFRVTKFIDDTFVDWIGVDLIGGAFTAKGMNFVLRIVQGGKIQMYFVFMIVVLCGYIISL